MNKLLYKYDGNIENNNIICHLIFPASLQTDDGETDGLTIFRKL